MKGRAGVMVWLTGGGGVCGGGGEEEPVRKSESLAGKFLHFGKAHKTHPPPHPKQTHKTKKKKKDGFYLGEAFFRRGSGKKNFLWEISNSRRTPRRKGRKGSSERSFVSTILTDLSF